MANDVVFIKDLEVEAVIGVFDWERDIRQALVFSIEMTTDARAAAVTDSLSDTAVNYDEITRRVHSFVESSTFELIETLAERLAQILIDEFGITWLRLTVDKPRPDSGYTAGLTIERP